jgi:flavin-binding protein dodecin
MTEHVYKLVELVGTSGASVSDAIQNAITRAAATVRNIKWFEVVQVRGEVKDAQNSRGTPGTRVAADIVKVLPIVGWRSHVSSAV